MKIRKQILCMVGTIMLLVSIYFFQTSYELLMEYMDKDSSYWTDIKDAQMVLRIALSSTGIVLATWTALIGLIRDKRQKDKL